MTQQASRHIQESTWEGSHHEVIEGIRLVGEEAPSSPGDRLMQAGMGEELRRIQSRARAGQLLARRYVGAWIKLID